MRKEYLEALEWLLANETIYRGKTRLLISPALRNIKQYLESIENINPSEALDNIKSLLKDDWVESVWKTDYEIIKQSLLKAQEYEEENKRLWNDITTVSKQYTDLMLDYQDQKRVLEIIKEKSIDVDFLKHVFKFNQKLEEYNNFVEEYQKLTQEEFELLKRWLG